MRSRLPFHCSSAVLLPLSVCVIFWQLAGSSVHFCSALVVPLFASTAFLLNLHDVALGMGCSGLLSTVVCARHDCASLSVTHTRIYMHKPCPSLLSLSLSPPLPMPILLFLLWRVLCCLSLL